MVAAAFLEHLAAVLAQPHDSVGDVLLKTRQALLADSKLLPLMLVTHGDADWKVA